MRRSNLPVDLACRVSSGLGRGSRSEGGVGRGKLTHLDPMLGGLSWLGGRVGCLSLVQSETNPGSRSGEGGRGTKLGAV